MSRCHRPRILLVDDDEQVVMNLAAFLEDEGYPVSVALDGPSGIALLRTRAHDAALVDLRMPGMDGFTFMTEARNVDPTIPFLVVTGSPDHILPEDLLTHGLGARDVIRKPIEDMHEVTRAVTQLLEAIA